MRYSENPSWELRLGIPEELNFALTVRATCDLAVFGLPDLVAAPLDGGSTIGPTGAISDRARASQEWSQWWTVMTTYRSGQLLRPTFVPLDPPDFETLQASPMLRQACRQIWPQFKSWWSGPTGRKQLLTGVMHGLSEIPNQLVADHEHRMRRTCRPFRFDIDVLAVDSMGWVTVDDAYAQIASPLLTDPLAFASWFRAILRKIG